MIDLKDRAINLQAECIQWMLDNYFADTSGGKYFSVTFLRAAEQFLATAFSEATKKERGYVLISTSFLDKDLVPLLAAGKAPEAPSIRAEAAAIILTALNSIEDFTHKTSKSVVDAIDIFIQKYGFEDILRWHGLELRGMGNILLEVGA